jgi:rhamnosyl/mannosyltransferase
MERVLQLLCEGERRHVDSRALVASLSRATEHAVLAGVPVTRVASLARIGSVAVSPGLAVELLRSRPDITVIHEPNPIALVADLVTGRRGPLLVYLHSEVVRPQWKYRLMYRPFLRRVLDRAARIIVASPAMASSAAQLEGYRHKCVVIPYGVDRARLRMTPAIRARVDELRADADGRPLVLFAGRLVPYKGADVLIRALQGVNARLVVVGDGPQAGALHDLVRQLQLTDRVALAGAVPDPELIALYHACDLFVLPSVTRAEAFGHVQVQAMASGKPVISTSVPSGVPWVNRHGETGLVVAPGDVEALRHALAMLVADGALRARLGAAGQRRVEEEFTAERMADRTVALYRAVLDGRVT